MLDGFRILEIGEYVAIPYAGKTLSDNGADVIKVEPPAGDVSRRLEPFPAEACDLDSSGYFGYLNTGKRSITLSTDAPNSEQILKDFVENLEVDLVIAENLERYGVTPKKLSDSTEGVTVVSVTGFGETGPFKDYDAPEIVAMAESGHMNKMGYPEKPPVRPGIKSADYWTGQHVVMSGLGALMFRDFQDTGRGQHVEVSKREVALTYMEGFISSYSWTKNTTQRTGSGYPTQGDEPPRPSIFETTDGHISISITFWNWEQFCTEVVDRPELVEDERFNDRDSFDENRDELAREVEEMTKKFEKWELFEKCQAAKVPSGVTSTPKDVVEFENLEERNFWQDVPLASGEEVVMPGGPFRVNWEPVTMERAPRLGEHNEEIFGELGYNVEQLKSTGVI